VGLQIKRILGSILSGATAFDLADVSVVAATDEIILGQGGPDAVRASVGDLLNTAGAAAFRTRILANPMFGAPVAGSYWENGMLSASAHTTLAGAANRIELAPVIFPRNFTVDRIAARCTTGVAAAEVKLLVYASDADGYPGTLIHETATMSAATTNTTQEATLAFTFLAGVMYWVGIRHSSTATMRAVALASTPSLGLSGVDAATHFTVLRRTLTYATAAPSPWAFVAGDRVASIAPTAIRFRAA
jgi:hypothetical protein